MCKFASVEAVLTEDVIQETDLSQPREQLSQQSMVEPVNSSCRDTMPHAGPVGPAAAATASKRTSMVRLGCRALAGIYGPPKSFAVPNAGPDLFAWRRSGHKCLLVAV